MPTHLSYSIPDRPRKKRILRIPESHSLYVCPQSCCRRQAIRAFRNGEADRMAFLQISQADLVSGDYEGQVADAVARLLDALPAQPRVMQLYVNCIDDFLGTDGEVLLEGLQEQFPDLRFSLSHINPIAVDVADDFASKMHSGLYGLLEAPAQRDLGVSAFGGFEAPAAESELAPALAATGAGPVRHIVTCRTFAEYQQLAKSSVAVCVSRSGRAVAEGIAARFGMRHLTWTATYGLDEVEAHYRQLAELLDAARAELAGCEADGVAGGGADSAGCDLANNLGDLTDDLTDEVGGVVGESGNVQFGGGAASASCEVIFADQGSAVDECTACANENISSADPSMGFLCEFSGAATDSWSAMQPVLDPAREAAAAAVRRAQQAVGSVPVVVGSDASFSPFELAFNLIEYGFDVRVVLALHMKGADEDAEARLLAAYPHVRTVREKSVDALEIDAEAANWLAIGADAAFLMGATRVVDMYHDEGYFGYQGIERLMNEVTAAMGEGADAAAKYAADANAVSADERAAVAFTATATKGAGE
jgi:hypothetical protein